MKILAAGKVRLVLSGLFFVNLLLVSCGDLSTPTSAGDSLSGAPSTTALTTATTSVPSTRTTATSSTSVATTITTSVPATTTPAATPPLKLTLTPVPVTVLSLAVTAGIPSPGIGATHTGPASLYPDPNLTPGAVFPGATAAEVCVPNYTKGVRDVNDAEKKEVFQRYQIADVPGKYEVDHFISLELGGSNDVTNLWPEPYEPKPGAREKDKVEDALHLAVCKNQITLEQAQTIIKTDWYAYYLKITN
ncbi:MAG TPA: HNH endonuclease signature motif containing protein [Chloroflexia bacterium]|nr:HNH endonuclease signature motif containing protein [Chloroflexia bacterium]